MDFFLRSNVWIDLIAIHWTSKKSPLENDHPLWMSPAMREAIEFLKGFKETAEQLAYNLKVVPHYHIFAMPADRDYEQMCTSDRETLLPVELGTPGMASPSHRQEVS